MIKSKSPKSLVVFDEPKLKFRYDQSVQDPHDGLSLFGPYDTDTGSFPGTINYMLIGTKKEINKFKQWSLVLNTPTIDSDFSKRLWPPFPGFKAVYGFEWPTNSVFDVKLNEKELLEASRIRDPHERADKVVSQYMEGIRTQEKLDENIDLVICIVPDDIHSNCRPKPAHIANPIGKRISNKRKKERRDGQEDIFDTFDRKIYGYSIDFRRQIKARAMKYGSPIQIIKESTLRLSNEQEFGERRLTPLSDRMWNLSVAKYYKAGGKPWKLISAREGVCYIGIAFKRTDDKNTACCAAQMFLQSGDGMVFLGDPGPYYSKKTRQFHLSRRKAKKLLTGILKTYKELYGKELREIFIHSRSELNDEEFRGFKEACPENVKLVGIRVRLQKKHPPKLYTQGKMPIIRGSFWKLNPNSGLFWGSGFKPRLATYDGWDTPIPLRIDVQYGDSPVERVAQDIYGLTKLNYNSCTLGINQPVTIAFSDAVGEILISNPSVSEIKRNFKYYI